MGATTVRLEDLEGRATINIWPELASLLGCGRDAAYIAVRSGQIPSIAVGARRLIPVGALLRTLGFEQQEGADATTTSTPGNTVVIPLRKERT